MHRRSVGCNHGITINEGEGCAHARVGRGVCWLSDVTQVATQLPAHCTSVGRRGRVSTFYRFVQVLEDLIVIINNVNIIKYNLCISQCLLLYFVNYEIVFICKKITEVLGGHCPLLPPCNSAHVCHPVKYNIYLNFWAKNCLYYDHFPSFTGGTMGSFTHWLVSCSWS